MKSTMILVFALLIVTLGLAACGIGTEPPQDDVGRLTPEEVAADVAFAMDTTADPCQDFYRYACGGWLDKTVRPADESRWGRSFSVIRDRNQESLRTLIEDMVADPTSEGEARKVADFYSACMDEEAINAAGRAPAEPVLEQIAAARDLPAILTLAGEMQAQGVSAFLDMNVFPDFKNPETYIAFYTQGGLGLPNREFYLREDPKSVETREKYRGHIARMLGLLGSSEEAAADQAQAIYDLELELAKVSRPPAAMRDMEKLYNKINTDGLQQLTPDIPWTAFLQATGHPEVTELSVGTPEFFERLQVLLAEVPLETVKTYLRWHWINAVASHLDAETEEANFDFFGRVLSGQQEQRPRWKRCVSATDGALGEALGKLYVERHFAGDSKAVALEMIGDIQAAFRANLPTLEWMDDETRARALEKAQAVSNKIGYPDRWRDYSTLEIKPGEYFGNRLAANAFEVDRHLSRVGGPVDRGEWLMSPPTVNAYYLPTNNEIAFPAGILQPPFFHRDFPAAMNYGGIGAVMGHELTHGFDDKGRTFDAEGKLREWWEPEVAERFEERADCVRRQYDRFEVEPGLNVNGELTAGENIADLGGVKQSFQAYQSWVGRHGEPEIPVEGLSDEQLFFVSFGQVWCVLASEEMQRMLIKVDSHSPPRFRVEGPLVNTPAFAEVFGCEAGDAMVAENRCEVW